MPTPDYSSPPKWVLPILGGAARGLALGCALGWGVHFGWGVVNKRYPNLKNEVIRFLRREPAPPEAGTSVADGGASPGGTNPAVAVRSNAPNPGVTVTNNGAADRAAAPPVALPGLATAPPAATNPAPVTPAPVAAAPVAPVPTSENRLNISWLTLGEPEVGSWVTNLVSVVNSGPTAAKQLSAEVKVPDSRVVAQAASERPVFPGAAFTFPVVWKVVSPGPACFGIRVDAGPGGITNFNHCVEAVLPKLDLEWQPTPRPVFGLFTTNVLRIASRSRSTLEAVVVTADLSGNGEVAAGGGTQFVIPSLAPGAAIQLGFVSALKANTAEAMSVAAEVSWKGRNLGRAKQDVVPWLPNIHAAFAGAMSGNPSGVMTVYGSLTNLGTETVKRLSVELEAGGRRVSAGSREAGSALDLASVGPGESRAFQFQLPQPAADLPARLTLADESGWKKTVEVLIRNASPAPLANAPVSNRPGPVGTTAVPTTPGGAPVRVTPGPRAPRPVPADPGEFPKVEYPAEARKNREEGTVRIEAQVMSNGRPLSVRVIESSGSVTLDRATVQHIRKNWRWPVGVARAEQMSVVFTLQP